MAGGIATCKNCGQRIVWVNYGWRPCWMHQAEGVSFRDGAYLYCKLSLAEPEDAPPVVVRSLTKVRA